MSRPFEVPAGRDMLPASASDAPDSPLRILVVDDDADIRETYFEALVQCGYQVDTAEDGAVGWKLMLLALNCDSDGYDLLITDNTMPKVSGVELIEKLRSACMALPIIMATSAPPINAEELQLAALLRKPLGCDQLAQTVEEVLHVARCKRESRSAPRQW